MLRSRVLIIDMDTNRFSCNERKKATVTTYRNYAHGRGYKINMHKINSNCESLANIQKTFFFRMIKLPRCLMLKSVKPSCRDEIPESRGSTQADLP